MKKNLFITESSNGEHHKVPSEFQADTISFVFSPNLSYTLLYENDKNFSALLPLSLKNVKFNDKLITISSHSLLSNLFKKYNKIFIGTDLDIEGNAMARVLLDFILTTTHKNIYDVIRVPLTNKGYVAVSNFWNNKVMLEYIKSRQDEDNFIQKSKTINGSYGVSRRTMLIANEILNPPESVKNINAHGTSSITYIFKKAIKEK